MENKKLIDLINHMGGFKVIYSKKYGTPESIKVEACVKKGKKVLFRQTKSFTFSMDGYHAADQWKREITHSVKIGKPINLIRAEGLTLEKAITLAETDTTEGWHQCKPDYVSACHKSLGHFGEKVGFQKNLNTLTIDDMEAYNAELLKLRKTNNKGKCVQLSFRALNQRLIHIYKVINLAHRRGYLKNKLPVIKFNEKNQPPIDKRPFRFVLNEDGSIAVNEEQDFYNACAKRGGTYNEYAMIVQLACHTGMREMELINARINWIDFESKMIRLPANATKAKKVREIALNPICMHIIKYFANRRKGNVKLLVSHYKAKLVREARSVHGDDGMFKWFATKLRHYFDNIKKDLGIDDNRLTFHSTRHTAITRMINNPFYRASVFDVKEWIGHADVHTTLGYWEKEARQDRTMSNSIMLHPANRTTFSNKKLLEFYSDDYKGAVKIPHFDGEGGQWLTNPKWKARHMEVVARNKRNNRVGRSKTITD